MPAFSVPWFLQRAEAYHLARSQRSWRWAIGERAGLGLSTLYDEDFPELTSLDLYADLHEAPVEDEATRRQLLALLSRAHMEGRTLERAEATARWPVRPLVEAGEERISVRQAQARRLRLADVPPRHALATAEREARERDFNPAAARWLDELLDLQQPLESVPWNQYWGNLLGLDLDVAQQMADNLLQRTAEQYGNALAVYLGQYELPIDDSWQSDAHWAFCAPRFDMFFPAKSLMPIVVRSFGDLGISWREQTSIQLQVTTGEQVRSGVSVAAINVPHEVRAAVRLVGGYTDYANVLRAAGQSLQPALTDATLAFTDRYLGDPTPTLAYGLLFQRLLSLPLWLRTHLEFENSTDFRIVYALRRLYAVRRAAALVGYEQRLWDRDAPGSRATDWDETLSGALRIRHFGEDYLRLLEGAPWSAYQESVIRLRAEVFEAQLARFLEREFDEEWWRNPRTGKFLQSELWRPGRRFSAEQLLSYMGEPGFDPGVLIDELLEVVKSV